MKSVVITGSTRGLGFEMAKRFLQLGWNVTICGTNRENVNKATQSLSLFRGNILDMVCDVKEEQDIIHIWEMSKQKWGIIDVWVNNAGINQPHQCLWDLSTADTHNVIQTNLMGTIYGSQIAMRGMIEQGRGQIFNMEGFGSNDMQRRGLNLYGTTKRAITYFTTALASEAAYTPVKVGLLSRGMMATDFIKARNMSEQERLDTEKIFNILGDKPDIVAKYLVKHISANGRNDAHFMWLTKKKAAFRFIKSMFVKRNLFESQVK